MKGLLRPFSVWVIASLLSGSMLPASRAGEPESGAVALPELPFSASDDAGWNSLLPGIRIRITLINGNRFAGEIRKSDADRITLHLESAAGLSQGTMAFRRAEIDQVFVLRRLDPEEQAAADRDRESRQSKVFEEFEESARNALKEKRAEEAIRNTRSALGLRPGDAGMRRVLADALVLHAEQLVKGEEFDEAATAAREAMDLFPSLPEYPAALGRVLVEGHRYEAALDPLRRAISLDSQNQELYARLATVEYWLDDLESAAGTVSRGLLVAPQRHDLQILQRQIARELDEVAHMDQAGSVHFQVRFKGVEDPSTGIAVLDVCEQTHTEYVPILGELRSPVRILLHGQDEYRAETGSEWVAGHYNPGENKIHVPLKNYHEHSVAVTETLRHELVHAMVAARVGDCPRWLHEGLAQNLSGEIDPGEAAHEREGMRGLLAEDRLPAVLEMEGMWNANQSDRAFAQLFYAMAYDFVHFLTARRGSEAIHELVDSLASGGGVESAVAKAGGASFEELEQEWRESLAGK